MKHLLLLFLFFIIAMASLEVQAGPSRAQDMSKYLTSLTSLNKKFTIKKRKHISFIDESSTVEMPQEEMLVAWQYFNESEKN